MNKVKVGDVFSESSHYIFERTEGTACYVKHVESGDVVPIGASYIEKYCKSADQFDREVRVGKEDKTDGTKGIRSIWEDIHSSIAFTVCFQKQDKEKSKKQYEADLETQRIAAIEKIEAAKTAKKSMAQAYADALMYIQYNPVLSYEPGEDRILRGFKLQFESRDGRYTCHDIDKNEVRPVNINTIKWLIIDGVKYIVQ